MRVLARIRLLGALAFVAGALPAANYRLSQGQSFSTARNPQVSPDGLWAAYEQDAQTDEAFELWRVSVEGGSPARLSGIFPSGLFVWDFAISPDSGTVVYTAAEDDLNHIEIFSASLDNPVGKGLKLNGALSALQNVHFFSKFAPDSSRVVYEVTQEGAIRELWSATLDGSDRDQLVATDVATTSITEYLITSDSQYVLFVLETAEGISSLQRVPLTGGSPVELSTDVPVDRGVTAFDVSPNGSEAAYIANRDGVNLFELFRVPVAGGEPLQISEEDPADYEVYQYGHPKFSFDGARVVYVVLNDSPAFELWSVEPDGDGNVKLNGLLVSGGTVQGLSHPFEINSSSSRVVYRANQQDPDNVEIYSVPIAGGAGVKLNGPPTGFGDVLEYGISRAGTHVAFRGNIELNSRFDLYATPILGGPSIRLSAVILFTTTLVGDHVLPGSGSLAFYIQTATPIMGDTTQRLWATPIGGGQRHRIDGCDAPGELVSGGLVGSPVHDFRVLYVANQEPTGQNELYAGEDCLLCTGFEGVWRWSSPAP